MPTALLILLAAALLLLALATVLQLRRASRLARRLFALFLLLSWLPALSLLGLQWVGSRRLQSLSGSPALGSSLAASLELGRLVLEEQRAAAQLRAAALAARWDDATPPIGVPGDRVWLLDAAGQGTPAEVLPAEIPQLGEPARRQNFEGHAVFVAREALGGDLGLRSLLLCAPLDPELDALLVQVGSAAGRLQQLSLFYAQLLRLDLLWTAGILTAVLLLLSLWLSRWFAARIGKPIEELANATRELAAGDLSHRVPVRSRDELGDLARDFNAMTVQLRESKEQLLRSERLAAWQGIARRLAHEIKNPLTPIHLALHRLRPHLHDATQLESLDTILEETQNLQRLAEEFSLFARLPQPHPTPVSMGEILRAVVALYRRHLGIEIRFESWPADDFVLADEGQLRQVLSNLVKNALEAMGEQGRLSLRAERQAGALSLEIQDDGVGLPGELDRIFDADFTTKSSGTGLGLAICRRIVEEHGGALSARPAPLRGAIFRLSLPLAQAESPS